MAMPTRKPHAWELASENDSPLLINLRRLMIERGINPYRLSRLAGLSGNFVGKIFEGASRNPAGANIALLAKALGVSQSMITGVPDDLFAKAIPANDESPTQRITIVGSARAGAWLEVDQSQDEPEEIDAPVGHSFPGVQREGWRIEGDSMNKTPLQNGVIAVCINMRDIGAMPPNRSIVIVRRTEDGGATFETTAKRLIINRDHFLLMPESTNPKHESITIPRDHSAEDAEISIAAVVEGSYWKAMP
jgi:SOS-response transcriptional repressor LexA